jgi:molybdate transport system regulatory protein
MKEADSGPAVAETGPVDICPAHRIWLHDHGTPVFGTGIRELLTRVESTGSLRQAASDMGLAYSKAWHIVRRAEDHLGFTLLVRKTGGRDGGGSVVSDEGRTLVGAFSALLEEADTVLTQLYAKHLDEWCGGRGEIQIDKTAR